MSKQCLRPDNGNPDSPYTRAPYPTTMTCSVQTEIPPLLRFRWEKGTRYYEAHIGQDLWGGWVLTRVWGRRNSPLGRISPVPCRSYEEALWKLAMVTKQRERRGYDPVG